MVSALSIVIIIGGDFSIDLDSLKYNEKALFSLKACFGVSIQSSSENYATIDAGDSSPLLTFSLATEPAGVISSQ